MEHEPELHVIKPGDLLGPEWRAERRRQAEESRRRHREHLAGVLGDLDATSGDPVTSAEAILDILFQVGRRDGEDRCHCCCHPHLPDSDFHDYGFGCPCRHTPEERRAAMAKWMAEVDAFWDSPEGRQLTAAREAEEAELDAWLAQSDEVVVTSHGGAAPEQWSGTVDGRSFYFRERHGDWRIELDLRPSGRFYRAWTGGDLDDDSSFEPRESEEGDVIAEGTVGVDGYGSSLVERARFIVETIRAHVRRLECQVHTAERDDLELLFGRPLEWCPACGARVDGPARHRWTGRSST